MELYGLQGTLTAKEGQGSELAQILLQAAELMKGAEGCYAYIVARHEGDPDSISVSEIWESVKYHNRALQLEGVSELIQKAKPLLASAPKGVSTIVLGGYGILYDQ